MGHYREARRIFGEGVQRFPNDARFRRHRGHRYLSVRMLDSAISDFEKGWALTRARPDEIEPDGLPNARNTPTSTLQSNICYHLGLSYYLKGDFERALSTYPACEKVSANPDMLVATRYWHYMTLRRLGREREASALLTDITPAMDIIENGAYHRLLLLNKGALPLDSLVGTGGSGVSAVDAAVTDASLWYGIGNWHLYNGRAAEAEKVFRRIVAGPAWSAFGYIAAEAELARARKTTK
jgi:tetratricopeptide (TPR) repeat protein